MARNDRVNGQRPGAISIAAALRYHVRPPGRPAANDHELINDFAGALLQKQVGFRR